jgi:hypothetical protein
MSSIRVATIALLLFAGARPAFAQNVTLEFRDGKVTLTATNAPLRTILSEWARLGGTQVVNGDKVTGAPVTLQLTDVSETQALDTILRGSAGYIVGLRAAAAPATQSAFDRILIVPTAGTGNVPAVRTAAPPPPVFTPRQQPPPPDPDDDPVSDVPPNDEPRRPGQGPNQPQPQEPPAPPAPTPGNPFGVQPGSTRPGVITPVPQPQQPNRPRSQPDNEP